MRDLSLLGKAIGMRPKFEIEVAMDAELEFKGLRPGATVKLCGSSRDYQQVEEALLTLAKQASGVAGQIRLDVRFGLPTAPPPLRPAPRKLRRTL